MKNNVVWHFIIANMLRAPEPEKYEEENILSQEILEGVKILDLSAVIAGPSSTAFLAEFGADVIRVEDPSGKDVGRTTPLVDGVGLGAKTLNRNKKCIALDLHTEEAQEIVHKLVKDVDVVVVNFRPNALKKFHIEYEDLIKINPQLIYVHFSAYGRTGPYRDKPGFARVAEAFAGLTYITGDPEGPPTLAGSWIVDGLGGIYTAYSIMLALYHKQRTGEGQLVDLGLYEPLFRLLDELPLVYSASGKVKERVGNQHAFLVPNNIYKCRDGSWMVMPVNGQMINRVLKAMGKPELIDDERFKTNAARVANRDYVDKTIADWVASYDRKELDDILNEFEVAHGPVNSAKDICENEQILARESVIKVYDEELGREILEPGIVPKMSKTPGRRKWSGPKLGADNEKIIVDMLGYSKEEFEAMKEKGVL